MAVRDKSFWILLIFILCGLVIGGLIGELAGKLSKEIMKENPQIEWQGLKSLRNRIVHDYEGVNLTMIWGFLTEELDELKEQISKII